MIKKCQKSFNAGKTNRELYPLKPCNNKLTKAHGTWRRQYDAFNIIESALENKIEIPNDYHLGGWTSANWRGELKRLPENLTNDISYRVLPGVLYC